VRSALRALLEAEAEFSVVAEAGEVEEAVRRVLAYKPRVLVLDLSMPGGSTLAAIPRMLRASPDTAIVVLTMEDEPRFAREALRAGALGFVLKESADSELVDAVHAAIRGERYLNPQLGGMIAAAPETPPGARPAPSWSPTCASTRCSRRHPSSERTARWGDSEVHRRIGGPALVGPARVARRSSRAPVKFLSVRTVESHRSHIQQKIGLSTRAELVGYARGRGLRD